MYTSYVHDDCTYMCMQPSSDLDGHSATPPVPWALRRHQISRGSWLQGAVACCENHTERAEVADMAGAVATPCMARAALAARQQLCSLLFTSHCLPFSCIVSILVPFYQRIIGCDATDEQGVDAAAQQLRSSAVGSVSACWAAA